MAEQNETGKVTFTSGEALGAFRQVKISAGSSETPPEVVYADAGEHGIGITQAKAITSGDPVTVRLWNASGTHKVTVSGAVTVGAKLYSADDGKLSATANGDQIAVAKTAGSADGSVIEAVFNYDSAYA